MALFSTDTPIKVNNYNVKQSPFLISVQKALVDPEHKNRIKITIAVTNNSSEILDAFLIGVECFTVFYEYSEHLGGYSLGDIKPGKTQSCTWSFLVFEPGLVGTIMTYPYKSRLKNGEVWKLDTTIIEEKAKELFGKELNVDAEEEKRKTK